jgi:hypothetical protein
VVHAKDDADGYGFTFKLDPVELGTDDDGDPINTLIVREFENRASKKKPVITGQAQRALNILSELIAQRGKRPPLPLPALPQGALTVTKDEWRSRCAELSLAEASGLHAQGVAFKRAVNALLQIEAVRTFSEWVWLGSVR